MKLKVRFAKSSEFAGCKTFDSRLTRSKFLSKVKEKEIIVATKKHKIIGYLRLEYIWLKIPYVSWILVKEDFRKLGIATKLIHFLCSSLKTSGKKFLLSSFQANAPQSKRWHTKLGFRACGKIRSINEDGSAEVFCQLKL